MRSTINFQNDRHVMSHSPKFLHTPQSPLTYNNVTSFFLPIACYSSQAISIDFSWMKKALEERSAKCRFSIHDYRPEKKKKERGREGQIERKTNTKRIFSMKMWKTILFSPQRPRSIDRKVLFVCFLAICWPSMCVRKFMNAFTKLLLGWVFSFA